MDSIESAIKELKDNTVKRIETLETKLEGLETQNESFHSIVKTWGSAGLIFLGALEFALRFLKIGG